MFEAVSNIQLPVPQLKVIVRVRVRVRVTVHCGCFGAETIRSVNHQNIDLKKAKNTIWTELQSRRAAEEGGFKNTVLGKSPLQLRETGTVRYLKPVLSGIFVSRQFLAKDIFFATQLPWFTVHRIRLYPSLFSVR